MAEGLRSIPAKGMSEPTCEVAGGLSIEVCRYSEHVTDPCPLEIFVVHDGSEAPVATVPAAVIAPAHALGDDVGGGRKLRPVKALATSMPEAHEDLVIRQPEHVRSEHPKPVEELAPV